MRSTCQVHRRRVLILLRLGLGASGFSYLLPLCSDLFFVPCFFLLCAKHNGKVLSHRSLAQHLVRHSDRSAKCWHTFEGQCRVLPEAKHRRNTKAAQIRCLKIKNRSKRSLAQHLVRHSDRSAKCWHTFEGQCLVLPEAKHRRNTKAARIRGLKIKHRSKRSTGLV